MQTVTTEKDPYLELMDAINYNTKICREEASIYKTAISDRSHQIFLDISNMFLSNATDDLKSISFQIPANSSYYSGNELYDWNNDYKFSGFKFTVNFDYNYNLTYRNCYNRIRYVNYSTPKGKSFGDIKNEEDIESDFLKIVAKNDGIITKLVSCLDTLKRGHFYSILGDYPVKTDYLYLSFFKYESAYSYEVSYEYDYVGYADERPS